MSKPTTKKTAAKKAAKKAPARKRIPGGLTTAEIRPLVVQANKAFAFQKDLGNVGDDETFDAWRREQVMECVGKPGLTACLRSEWRQIHAHFLALAGDDGRAFQQHMRTGKTRDHAEPGDTYEAREQLAHVIVAALEAHIAEADAGNAEIDANGGPIREGYLVYIVRQKTRRFDLSLGRDLRAGLAERCTTKQLEQIRNTLVNRIAAKEGRGSSETRNKSQTIAGKRARKTDQTMDQTPRVQ